MPSAVAVEVFGRQLVRSFVGSALVVPEARHVHVAVRAQRRGSAAADVDVPVHTGVPRRPSAILPVWGGRVASSHVEVCSSVAAAMVQTARLPRRCADGCGASAGAISPSAGAPRRAGQRRGVLVVVDVVAIGGRQSGERVLYAQKQPEWLDQPVAGRHRCTSGVVLRAGRPLCNRRHRRCVTYQDGIGSEWWCRRRRDGDVARYDDKAVHLRPVRARKRGAWREGVVGARQTRDGLSHAAATGEQTCAG